MRENLVWGSLVAGVLSLVPSLFDSPYVTTVLITVLLLFALGMVFDFMLGFLNIVNFGIAGFLACGAYTSGLLSNHYGFSPWLGLLAGGVSGLLLGLGAGLVTLRLRGIYVGLATLFIAELIRFSLSSARDVTRGMSGLSTPPFPDIGNISFDRSNLQSYYYLILIITALIYLSLTLVTKSKIGLLFRAIKDNELSVNMLGFNSVSLKLLNFAIASFCLGVLGAFYGTYIGILVPAPQEFGVPRTVEVLTVAYVGGRGTLWGSLLGALALIGLQESFRMADEWRLVIYGVFLVIVLIAFPRGLAGGAISMMALVRTGVPSALRYIRKLWKN